MQKQSAWSRLAHSKGEALLVAGFGLYWAFFDSSFYGLTLAQSQPAFAFPLHTLQTIGLFTSVLAAALVVALPKTGTLLTRGKTVGALSAVAVLALVGAAVGAGAYPLVAATLLVVSSLCISLVMFSWVGLYARPTVQSAGILVAGSIALGGILELLIAILQPQFALAAIALLPVAGTALYLAASSSIREENDEKSEATAPAKVSRSLGDLGLSRRFIWALIIFSLAVGVTQFLSPATSTDQIDRGIQFRLMARYGIALIVFLGAALMRWRPYTMYRVGALVVIGGFLLLPFLAPQVYFMGSVIANAGYTCVELMVWTVVFESARTREASAIVPIGITRLLMGVGAFAGVVFDLALSQWALSANTIQALNSSIVYAMVIATVLVLDNKSDSESWYLIERSFPSANKTPSFSATCHRMAEEAGLTSREQDVFTLLASGRSAPYIANELGIAVSTVNFHVRHVYEKFGVNTKQNLIDLVKENQEIPSSE